VSVTVLLGNCRWNRGRQWILLLLFVGCKVDDRRLAPINWTFTENGNGGSGGTSSAGCDGMGDAYCIATAAGSSGYGTAGNWATAGSTNALAVAGGLNNAAGMGGAASSIPLGNYPPIAGAFALAGSMSTAGRAGMTAVPLDACADLNNNSVADRSETLARNSSFDSGPEQWDLQPGVSIAWAPNDGCGSSRSGSLEVTYRPPGTAIGWHYGAVSQCIVIPASTIVFAAALIFLPNSGDRAAVGVSFFGAADCTGNPLNSYDSASVTATSAWTRATVPAYAPPDARAMTVRLFVGRSEWPTSQTQAKAQFDSVLAGTVQ